MTLELRCLASAAKLLGRRLLISALRKIPGATSAAVDRCSGGVVTPLQRELESCNDEQQALPASATASSQDSFYSANTTTPIHRSSHIQR